KPAALSSIASVCTISPTRSFNKWGPVETGRPDQELKKDLHAMVHRYLGRSTVISKAASTQRPASGWWQRLRHWRENRQLSRLTVTADQWQQALGDWAVYQRYRPEQQRHIQELALRLLL